MTQLKYITLIFSLLSGLTAMAKNQQKPNIVLLFSDDAGYGDFGFHGSKTFKTPNLDKLAKEGLVFKQAYVTAAVCGPSRAGMLTGRYQQRFGYEENNVPGIMSTSSALMGDEMGLPTHLPTIGDYLKQLGYRTAILGKWHLGGVDKYHPLKRGFDEFYGFRGGARSFWELTKTMKEKNTSRPHEMLFWKKENRGVIRMGDFKLLRFPDRPAELYNIAVDEREHNNLVDEQPEKVKEMYKLLFDWEKELERPLWQLERF